MQPKTFDSSGVIISALSGGSGKTLVSIGIIAALSRIGKKVAPFKKGPDYIDAGWLALAAGRPCFNLDTFIIDNASILQSFQSNTTHTDIAVIEGNRGLYDGVDAFGSTSTAELAKLIQCPLILCVDCTKATRTIAAIVSGCLHFDPDVAIKGVILNRIAGSRHKKIVTQCIEHYCGIPVIGALPKLDFDNQIFPERHMGLVPSPEHAWAMDSVSKAADIAKQHINLDVLVDIADRARHPENVKTNPNMQENKHKKITNSLEHRPTIGIFLDSAFQFYYPENITALQQAGANIIYISPLEKKSIPDVDAIYMGGGFPETHAQQLSENKDFKKHLTHLARNGLPIYAECGGLMYLGQTLVFDKKTYEMSGVLPVVFGFSGKPQGHGYTVVHVKKSNPFFNTGTILKGHEFHYSQVIQWNGSDNDLVFSMEKGNGIINKKDGILYKNVLATYTHIHALGTPGWAKALVQNALTYKKGNRL
jgi:cobyrinic acid a,c-diamide synthase